LKVKLKSFWELTKPNVTSLVLVATFIGFKMAMKQQGESIFDHGFLLFNVLLGSAFVSGGVGTLNEYLERYYDSLMHRTQSRPLPSGKLTSREALIFGIGISFFGMIYLTITVNPLTGLLSILTLVLYLFVYTPLKRKTAWNLFIGAIPGAIPPVGGWIAAGGDLSPVVWMLFGVLFLWQIPHFLSIAWIYRKDYQRAGFRMIGMPGSPLMITFLGTIGCSVVLLLLTLGLFLTGIVGKTYLVGATVIGVSFLILTICMAVNRSNRWAHRLLLGSVLYLPSLLLFMIID
jgi:protoheme IX farnesyltransferase